MPSSSLLLSCGVTGALTLARVAVVAGITTRDTRVTGISATSEVGWVVDSAAVGGQGEPRLWVL